MKPSRDEVPDGGLPPTSEAFFRQLLEGSSEDGFAQSAIVSLQIAAIREHQIALGRGDTLVQLLLRTVHQLELATKRVQYMSLILFVAGLCVLAAGVYVSFFTNDRDGWSVLLAGTGGIASVVAVFWTAPVEKITNSVTTLVKLETIFLGYIRVVGEVDSSFQMQYLHQLRTGAFAETNPGYVGFSSAALAKAVEQATSQVQAVMEQSVRLLSADPASDHGQLRDFAERLTRLEEFVGAPPTLEEPYDEVQSSPEQR